MRIEYIAIRHDPDRDLHIAAPGRRQETETPLTDFVMSWANGFRIVAAFAAFCLIVEMIGG